MARHDQLIDSIYEAATKPDLWTDVLDRLGKQVGAAGGVIITRRHDRWLGYRCTESMAPGVERFLFSDLAMQSVTTPRLLAFPRAGFVADQELFSDEEFRNDVMMTEWAAPLGLHRGAATAIQVPNGDMIVVQFQRRQGQPKLGPDDLQTLDAFRPHLARSGLLAARWRLDRVRAVATGLAMIGLPAAVVGLGGRVLAANDLLQAMTPHVAWLPNDRVALHDRAANQLLAAAFATIGDAAAETVRSFPARAPDSGEAVVVHLVPATGEGRDLFEGGFGILVVTPVAGPNVPDASLLQGLFDLTAAEARVARDVGAGLSVGEIAARHAVSDNTVRSHLKMVFAKTGVGRQAEVASLVSSLVNIPFTAAKDE